MWPMAGLPISRRKSSKLTIHIGGITPVQKGQRSNPLPFLFDVLIRGSNLPTYSS